MENYVVVILSGCCSLIAAAVVAIVSGIITRKNQKEEKLNEKRLEIYNEIIIGIDKLISLPNKVFDDEYFATWIKYKGYIKTLQMIYLNLNRRNTRYVLISVIVKSN